MLISLKIFVVVAAVLLDRVLGEPRRWHPLIGFGRIAAALERLFNARVTTLRNRNNGLLVLLLLLLPAAGGVQLLALRLSDIGPLPALLFDILVLYLVIGWRCMLDTVQPLDAALARGDILAAREIVGGLVSRDCESLSAPQLLSAGLESMTENSNDALFASLFWYLLLGPAGAVLHRLSNTLDAMWGYRNPRFQAFGWAAARLDDLLGFIPAQLLALSFALVSLPGSIPSAGSAAWRSLSCWWRQGWRWKSINAGSVMASAAGALGICLGGVAVYDGLAQTRSVLGAGRTPEAGDVAKVASLVNRALLLWLAVAMLIAALMSGVLP